MINELLAKRDVLADIAEAMYGEFWITEEVFWNSPTELQMREVESQLLNLGWSPKKPTSEEKAIGEMIFEEMVKKGKFPRE
jgi:hypothetical protein